MQIEILITSLSCTKVLLKYASHPSSTVIIKILVIWNFLEFILDNSKLNANCENLTFSKIFALDSDLNSGMSLKSFNYKVLASHNS